MHLPAHELARTLGDWRTSGRPAHQSLSTAVRLAILDGRVALGHQLPSERSLAYALGISRTTVTTAYRDLADQGFVATSERRRPRVTLPASPVAPVAAPGARDVIDLTSASPRAPERLIHEAYAAALNRLPAHLGRTGYDRSGIMEAREAVARWFTGRGLETRPSQILITHGAQHALSLIARTLLAPHARVALEHPTYPNALELFGSIGARITALPPVRDRTDLGPWQRAMPHADLTYLVADFHNPTGTSVPAELRPALRARNLVVVDESMVALGLDGTCLPDAPPVASVHPRALTIGSVSKCLWGGLRVGWIRAPEEIIARLALRRSASDLGNSVLDQLAVADLLDAGHAEDAAASSQRTQRCDSLRRALLASALDIHAVERPAGGLSLWLQLDEPVAAVMATRAREFGLALTAGPRFSPTGAFQRHLRIPFTLPEDHIEPVVARLEALRDAVR